MQTSNSFEEEVIAYLERAHPARKNAKLILVPFLQIKQRY